MTLRNQYTTRRQVWKPSAHLGNGQTPQGCLEVWGSRGVPPAVERAKRPLWADQRGQHLALAFSGSISERFVVHWFCAGRWLLNHLCSFLWSRRLPQLTEGCRHSEQCGSLVLQLLRLSVHTSKLISLQFGGTSYTPQLTCGCLSFPFLCTGETTVGQAEGSSAENWRVAFSMLVSRGKQWRVNGLATCRRGLWKHSAWPWPCRPRGQALAVSRYQRAVLMLGSVILLTNCKIRFLFVCFCSFATFTSFIVVWGKQHPQ